MADSASVSGTFQIFEQELKSGDDTLLNHFINNSSPNQIPDFIHHLQPTMISYFLRKFTNYIQKKPEALSKALPWIEEGIDYWQREIKASTICQQRVAELQHALKQRTQQIGIFIEVDSLSSFVEHEKDGEGIGLPIDVYSSQTLFETLNKDDEE